jgi:putative RNA 2'-phosphotransferase
MDKTKHKRLSKTLSYHLRHAPEEIGLTLGEGGWVKVEDLLHGLDIHKRLYISTDELEEIVADCPKKRYSFNETHNMIRANQGHSVDVDLQLKPAVPPEVLYHGTAERNVENIRKVGLQKMGRHHVHLSKEQDTARTVGARHGKPVVLEVKAGEMHRAGFEFFVSENGVWLTGHVPFNYLA